MLEGAKLTFDEESQALYDAVAPTHPDSYFEATLKEIAQALPGEGPLVDRYEAFRRKFIVPADRLSRVFDRAIAECRGRTLPHVQLAGQRNLHRRVRPGQAMERLQLVSGHLPQPDPGEHRSADLHRPRDRPRVPRGLSRASRLQRAAREAPRARSRVGRVLRLRALLAAVADRRGHGELRHRGGVSRRRTARVRTGRAASRWPDSTDRRRPRTQRSERSSIVSPMRATKPRAST